MTRPHLSIEQLEDRSVPSVVAASPKPPRDIAALVAAEHGALESMSGLAGSVGEGVAFAEGVNGNAFSFEKPGAAVHVASQNIEFERNTPFTVDCWAKIDDLSGDTLTLFEKGEFTQNRSSVGAAIRIGATRSLIDVWLQGANNGNRIYWRGVLPALDTEWHHYAISYDGNSDISGVHVFMDGKELSSMYTENGLNTSIANSERTTLGSGMEADPVGQFAKGKIDEFRFFKKSTPATDIPSLMVVTTPETTKPESPSSGSSSAELIISAQKSVDVRAIEEVFAERAKPPFPEGLAFRHDDTIELSQPGSGMSFPASVSPEFDGKRPFSVSAWARIDDVNGDALTIFEKGEFAQCQNSVGMALRPSGTSLLVDVWLQGSSNTNRIYWRGKLSTVDTGWHQYAVSYDGTDAAGIRVYIDGEELQPTYVENTLMKSTSSNAPMTVGSGFESDPVRQFTKGAIKDLRIFGKHLSQEEVKNVKILDETESVAPDADSSLMEPYRLPDISMTGLQNIATRRMAEIAGLTVIETPEQIAKRIAPGFFAEGASPSARGELIWSIHKEMGYVEEILGGAAAAAFREIYSERTGTPDPYPGSLEKNLTSHPRMGVIGSFGILPSAAQVRSAVNRHFQEMYRMLWDVKTDEMTEQQRLAHEEWKNPPAKGEPEISQDVHRRVMETILGSDGGIGTPTQRIMKYVKKNPEARASIPVSVREEVIALLDQPEVIADAETVAEVHAAQVTEGTRKGINILMAEETLTIGSKLILHKQSLAGDAYTYTLNVTEPMMLLGKALAGNYLLQIHNVGGDVLSSVKGQKPMGGPHLISESLVPGKYTVTFTRAASSGTLAATEPLSFHVELEGAEKPNSENTMIVVIYGSNQFVGLKAGESQKLNESGFEPLLEALRADYDETWAFSPGFNQRAGLRNYVFGPSPTETQPAIISAVASRLESNKNLKYVTFIGYSWGGGMVYDVTAWLSDNFPDIAIAGTVYVDAVNDDGLWAAENRMPLGTRAMLNIYQTNTFVNGGKINHEGQLNDFTEITLNSKGHDTIDEDSVPYILNFIHERIVSFK